MIDYKNFDLYTGETVDKQLKITFDSGTITNTEIPSEQFELTESLTSESQLVFGSCEASEIKFRIYNVFLPLKDKWLTVTQTLNGDTENPLQIGKYKVYSDKPTADRGYRDVVAYDTMYDIINTDVASWYNGLTFPMKLKAFRDSFFAFFGIEQIEVSLVNDSMQIERTIDVQVLSGKDVIQSICQINGCFGHIGRDGKFKYVFLKSIMGGLYPSNDIYPANDLFPQQPNVQIVSKGLYVDTPTYEDFTVKPIDKLQIREKEGDIGVIVGNGDNTYIVEDNFLVYGKSTEDLTVIAENMLSVIEGLEYRPFDAALVGNPCIEVGDGVRLHTKYQIIDSYVLQRTLSGVQALRDEFLADGEEYQSEKVNDIQTDIKQLKGKSNTLERTLEETKSTIADVGKGLQSEITQTAESIRLEVADNTGKISTIEQDIDSITQTVEDNKKELSSRIEQTVKSISLTVNNGDSTAGIVITLENEDGTTKKVSGTIDMTGMVTFNDLKNKGQTVINGSNITTGEISCDLLNGGTINGQTIKGSYISGSSGYFDKGFNVIVPLDDGGYFEITNTQIGYMGPSGVNSYFYFAPGSNSTAGIIHDKGDLNFSASNGNIYFNASGTRTMNINRPTIISSLSVTGTKSRLASTENSNDRLLYCYETPSPFFGDIGHGVIGEDGTCYVDIDSIFAETIDTIQEYYVFLTPYKTDKAMFVEEKEHGYFIVKGEPNTEFDWEIKAKQLDYPMERLEENIIEDTNDIDYEEQAINYLNEYEKELTEV